MAITNKIVNEGLRPTLPHDTFAVSRSRQQLQLFYKVVDYQFCPFFYFEVSIWFCVVFILPPSSDIPLYIGITRATFSLAIPPARLRFGCFLRFEVL